VELVPGKEIPKDGWPETRSMLRRVDGTGDGVEIPKMDPAAAEFPGVVRWSADGNQVLVCQPLSPPESDGYAAKYGHWEYDPATGRKTEIKLPPGHQAVDWTADRNRLLTQVIEKADTGRRMFRGAIVDRRTGKVDFLLPPDRHTYPIRLSPDGSHVLCVAHQANHTLSLCAIKLSDGTETRLTDPAGEWSPLICGAWSPDGSRIAYARKKYYSLAGADAAANVQLVICDADGSNPKVIAGRTLLGEPLVRSNGFTVLDWR
jgi:dipeptidyl aminopeptidase/acylaminoacyl peptidase